MQIKVFEGGLRGVTVVSPISKGNQVFFAPLSLMITEDFTNTSVLASVLVKPKNKKKHDNG